MPVRLDDDYMIARPLRAHSGNCGVCILAAGLAKRLEPISDVIAKPAFPLAGSMPIAELWVRKFADAGLSQMAMNLHRVPESIRGHFGDGKRFLAEISYVEEETPSGTLGGAISMVKALNARGFHPERVFIPSGDIVSGVGADHLQRMLEAHISNGAAVTMMLAPIPWERRGDFGTAVLDGIDAGQPVSAGTYARILDFVEKDPDSPSNENNASNYLIETSFLMQLEPYLTRPQASAGDQCYDFGKHLFMGMKGKVAHLSFLTQYKDNIFGFEPGTLWFDVGNKRDYLAVNKAVLNKAIPLNLPYNEYPWGWMGENVEMDFSRVTIHPPVVIGHNCTIFPGVQIGPNVVLGDGWTCHKNSIIKDAVLWRDHDHANSAGDPSPRMSRIREVREGIVVDTAIIVGGIISDDVRGKTVDAKPDGELDIRSIDWLPTGVRA